MNTYIDYELNDGNSIKLTLNLKKLLVLKSSNPEIYDSANRIIIRGVTDIFDLVSMLYAAYLCGLNNLEESPMSYDTFMGAIPQNIDKMILTVDALISPKKK